MRFTPLLFLPLLSGIGPLFSEETLSSSEKEVKIQKIVLKGGEPLLQEQIEAEFIGKDLTVETIKEMKQTILLSLKEETAHCLVISIPDQDVSSGNVMFSIEKSRIGQISYSDTRWFKKELFEKKIPLIADQPLDKNRLLDDASWMNRNPFHYTQVILSPGSETNTTRVELNTKERVPIRLYAGADNTGTSFSENARLYTGFTWGNALWCNDLFSFQYMTSPDFFRFISYYGNYTSFLPCKHILTVYGGYSLIRPQISDFKSQGKTAQASLRYQIPFKPLYTPFQQELSMGFDYKFINSNLFFIGESLFPIVTHAVNVAQFTLGYQLQDQKEKHQPTFKLEGFASLGSWLPHQSKKDYHGLRADSHVSYFYARTALGDIYTLPRDFKISGLLRGQLATGPLLPSEQFGLGGSDTVRGYFERAFNADDALCLNVELHTPSLLSKEKKKGEVYFLGFFDLGYGYNYRAQPLEGILTNDYLISIGPGFRWNIKTHLSARVDYGFQLHHIQGDNRLGMCHAGIVLSY